MRAADDASTSSEAIKKADDYLKRSSNASTSVAEDRTVINRVPQIGCGSTADGNERDRSTVEPCKKLNISQALQTYVHTHTHTRITMHKLTYTLSHVQAQNLTHAHTQTADFMCSIEEDARTRAERRKERERVGKEWKKKGTLAFRSSDYHSAIDCYSKAIKEMPWDITLYTNRALVSIYDCVCFHSVLLGDGRFW